MKKLTIEEKAKRYDEALERARRFYNSNTNEGYRKIFEDIFSELAEDEDEKIRKYLLRCAEVTPEGYFKSDGLNKENVIAWLEKQGEQKPFDYEHATIQQSTFAPKQDSPILSNSSNIGKNEQNPNANCLLSWSEIDEKMLQSLEGIVKDYWAKAEQEKNEIKIREASNVSYFLKTIQKSPLCWIKCSDGLPNRDGTYLVVTDGLYNEVYDMARYDSIEGWHKASEIISWMPIPQLNNKSIIEQKPAWSEEDDEHLSNALFFVREYQIPTRDKKLLEAAKKAEEWLKSLKNRYIPQPKQEWSEEDDEMLEEALNQVKYAFCEQEGSFWEDEPVLVWLKSLKERIEEKL